MRCILELLEFDWLIFLYDFVMKSALYLLYQKAFIDKSLTLAKL